MRPRILLNLVLAAVVAVLGWLAVTGGDAPAPQPGLPVTTRDPAAIGRIDIAATGQRPVRLVRDGESWRIDAPYRAPADPFRVGALLGLASARSARGFRAAGNDLSQYGLEPALASVAFDDEVVLVGATDPVENLRYVRSADQVHLLPDRWFSQVFGDAAAWVDPRPLAGATDLVSIALPQARWQRDARGWRRSPDAAAPSADAGTRLADAWRHARALSVRALDPAAPWTEQVGIALRGRDRPLVFTVATTRDAVLLGNPGLGVQYRFLPRQGDALLGRSEPPGG